MSFATFSTFTELPYERPNLESYRTDLEAIKQRLTSATHPNDCLEAVADWNQLRIDVSTMHSLAEVRYTQNVKDPVWKAEKEFFDVESPNIQDWNNQVEQLLVSSAHRAAIEEKYGSLFLTRMEQALRVFAPEIKSIMVEEARLCEEYNNITASARIELNGTTYNLSTIGKLAIDLDRDVRRQAVQAQYAFLGEHARRIDEIYHELVQLRTSKARALGFANYVDFRYVEFGRVDYGAAEVASFRQSVIDHVVPLVSRLKQAQAKRLGRDTLALYDEKLMFADGNPIAE
ncbi:MAG: M3 family metallopeptidase, partial [Candidatus Kapaibacteriota bacterium]